MSCRMKPKFSVQYSPKFAQTISSDHDVIDGLK